MTRVYDEAVKLVTQTGGDLTAEQLEEFEFLALGFNNQEKEDGESMLRETIEQKIRFKGSKFQQSRGK